jgi:hypothetical protein
MEEEGEAWGHKRAVLISLKVAILFFPHLAGTQEYLDAGILPT